MEFVADWADLEPAPVAALPQRGEPWICDTNEVVPYLRCVHAKAVQSRENPYLGTYTAWFSTEQQLSETFCDVSLEIGLEPGEEGTGYTWKNAGTPVVDATPPPIPVGVVSVRLRLELPPYEVVMGAAGKINDRVFLGYPVGCALFLGANADNSYDLSGNILSAAAVYKFSVKLREHKYFWRPPLQARDASGNLIYWHNIDENEPYYTTDATKAATPVWIHETPDQETNIAGIGDWDEWEKDAAPYHEECDFASVLGIPDSSL
jgi:hypothetical protein